MNNWYYYIISLYILRLIYSPESVLLSCFALRITAHIFYLCCVNLHDYINKPCTLTLITKWNYLIGHVSFKYESCLLMYSERITLCQWHSYILNFTFTNFSIVKICSIFCVNWLVTPQIQWETCSCIGIGTHPTDY